MLALIKREDRLASFKFYGRVAELIYLSSRLYINATLRVKKWRTCSVQSAGVAELADALALGASDRKIMWVQIPPPAHSEIKFSSRAIFFCARGMPYEFL